MLLGGRHVDDEDDALRGLSATGEVPAPCPEDLAVRALLPPEWGRQVTYIERQAASRYWPQRRELPGEQGMSGGWYWLLLDRQTGDYVPCVKFDTREEALALVEVLS